MRRGPAVFLLFCLLFGAAYGAWWTGQEGFYRLNHDALPFAAVERPTAGPPPLADRLVLLLIDDLRTEEAHLLPSLDWIRQQGASYRLTVPGPQNQQAVLATLLTGAPPTLHGEMGLAATDRPFTADHLLQAAARAKMKTGGVGGPALSALAAGSAETWYTGGDSGVAIDQIQSLLKPGGPRLVLIQVGDLAAALRAQRGEGAKPDYREALAALDGELVAILDQIDWKTTAVMVTGTAPLNSLGTPDPRGAIPLLMAGKGVLPGARGDGSLLDLAPTAAALAGLPTPLEAQGKPLLAALQVEGRPADAVMQRYLASRQAFTAALLRSLGSEVVPADPPTTAAEADGYLATLDQQVKESRMVWLKAGLMERLPYLGGGALVLLLYLLIVYKLHFGRAIFVGHLLYGAIFHLIFFLVGGRYGPEMVGLDAPMASLRLRFGLVAGAAMLLASVGAGLLLSRKEFKRTRYLVAAALHLCLSLAVAIALPIGIALLLLGWEFPTGLPATGFWIWFCLAVWQVMLVGALSPIWTWAAVRTARYGRRRWPPKEIGNPEINADKVVRLQAIRRSSKHQRTR